MARVSWKRRALKRTRDKHEKQMSSSESRTDTGRSMGQKEPEYNERNRLRRGKSYPKVSVQLPVYRRHLKTLPKRRLSILTLRIQDRAETRWLRGSYWLWKMSCCCFYWSNKKRAAIQNMWLIFCPVEKAKSPDFSELDFGALIAAYCGAEKN